MSAKFLGCHSIRVNASTDGKLPRDEQQKHAVAGLRKLAELGAKLDLNVIVENHGGLSSDGSWLSAVMKEVGTKTAARCRILEISDWPTARNTIDIRASMN